MKTKPRYVVQEHSAPGAPIMAVIRHTKRNRNLKQPHGSEMWDQHHAEVACDFFNLAHEDQNGTTVS